MVADPHTRGSWIATNQEGGTLLTYTGTDRSKAPERRHKAARRLGLAGAMIALAVAVPALTVVGPALAYTQNNNNCVGKLSTLAPGGALGSFISSQGQSGPGSVAFGANGAQGITYYADCNYGSPPPP